MSGCGLASPAREGASLPQGRMPCLQVPGISRHFSFPLSYDLQPSTGQLLLLADLPLPEVGIIDDDAFHIDSAPVLAPDHRDRKRNNDAFLRLLEGLEIVSNFAALSHVLEAGDRLDPHRAVLRAFANDDVMVDSDAEPPSGDPVYPPDPRHGHLLLANSQSGGTSSPRTLRTMASHHQTRTT